jgi:hypothetical protein
MQSTDTIAPPSSSAGAFNLAEIQQRLPQNLTLRRRFGGIEIVSHRRNWRLTGFLAAFCAFWDTMFVIVAASGTLPLIFWFSHGLSGLFLTSWLLNLVVNHTRIEVAHGQLRVQRGPLPWPGRITVDVANIKALSVGEGTTTLNGRVLPALWLEETDGRRRSLIDPLPDEEVGRALEILVEDHLAIDESAPGRLRQRPHR